MSAKCRYLIVGSRAGFKAIKIGDDSISLSNANRVGWLGDNLRKEYDDLFKGETAEESVDRFNTKKDNTSIFAIRAALQAHKRDAWYPRVADKNDK